MNRKLKMLSLINDWVNGKVYYLWFIKTKESL